MPDTFGGIKLPEIPSGAYLEDNGTWSSPAGGGGGADVKSGIVNLGAGGTANVSFAISFSGVPRVVAIPQFSTTDTSTTISCYNVTTDGFTMRGAGNAAGNVAWIATDAGG